MRHTITKREFRRGGQMFVLQGLWHIAPAYVFEHLQEEMDEAVRQGFQVFAEGVYTKDEEPVLMSKSRVLLREFIFGVWALFKPIAQSRGWDEQEHTIRYPGNYIRADVKVPDLVEELRRHGIYVSPELVAFVKNPVYKELLADSSKNPEEFKKLEGKLECMAVRKILKMAVPVFVDFRNQVAINYVDAHMKGKPEGKAWMHYGEGHIAGLSAIAVKRGWRLEGKVLKHTFEV